MIFISALALICIFCSSQADPAIGENKGTNLALKKPVTSSSQWGRKGGPGGLTDGEIPKTGKWDYLTCLCTRKDNGPWVQVDLGASTSIDSVEVFNSLYWSWWKRTFPFEVRVGDSTDVHQNAKCGQTQTQATKTAVLSVSCGGLRGRYVGVLKTNRNYLNICEIKVFGASTPSGAPTGNGIPGHAPTTPVASYQGNDGATTNMNVNLALHATVTSSSQWGRTGGPEGLTDGNTPPVGKWDYHTCLMTRNDNNGPWVRVDLGSTKSIDRVDVYNSLWGSHWLRTYPFEVRIGDSTDVEQNPMCGHRMEKPDRKPSTDLMTVTCPGARGRYIGVKKTNRNYLNICEVKAFGPGGGSGSGGTGGGTSGGTGGGSVQCGLGPWTEWTPCVPQNPGSCDGNQKRFQHPVPASCDGLNTDSRNCNPCTGGVGGGNAGGNGTQGNWGPGGEGFPELMMFCNFQSQSFFWCH